MNSLKTRLVLALTLSLLAISVAQLAPNEPSGLLAAAAAIAVLALLCARHAALAVRSREITVGLRARTHRELLSCLPEPQHPDTAGRPRSRAPARPSPAA